MTKNKKTAKEQRFINMIKRNCKKYGIKCELRNVKYLKLSGNIKCSGYFDETDGKLVVAMNRRDWIEILAHEYCHLTQWIDGVSVYKLGGNAVSKVDEWLEGKNIRSIKKWLGYARDMELDNEKRTVALLTNWGFGLDLKLYVKKSNAYVQFYNYLYHSRKWSKPENSPYTNRNVLAAMPTKFNMNYEEMDEDIFKLFQREGI
jgi:hypothetical protein